MAYTTGFSDKFIVVDNGTNKTIYTMGDYTYSRTRTEIPVKTKGSETVRYVLGMKEVGVSFTVYAGTDPADTNSFDAFAFFKTMFDSKTVKQLTIEGETHDYVCSSFENTTPIDDLKAATVTLKVATSDSSSSSSSSSQS